MDFDYLCHFADFKLLQPVIFPLKVIDPKVQHKFAVAVLVVMSRNIILVHEGEALLENTEELIERAISGARRMWINAE